MNTKTKAVLAFLVIFLLGGISGYLIKDSLITFDRERSYQSAERQERQRMSERSFNSEEERALHRQQMRQRAQNRLSDRLDLEDNQKADFFDKFYIYQSEIRDSVRSIRSIEQQFVREHYNRFRKDVDDILNEDQIQNLDRFFHPDSIRQNQAQRYHR